MTVKVWCAGNVLDLSVRIEPGPFANRDHVILSTPGGPTVFVDENHAAALVLALQAAIAEIQARAVSR